MNQNINYNMKEKQPYEKPAVKYIAVRFETNILSQIDSGSGNDSGDEY